MNKTLIASDMNCGIGNYHVAVMRQVILSPVHLYFCKMKEIKLTQGKVALVDDEDYEYLNKWNWHYHNKYAFRSIGIGNGKQKRIPMEKFIITDVPQNMAIDHIDGCGLNNQRSNLRVVTIMENQWNISSHKNSSSKYIGVSYYSNRRKYRSGVNRFGKYIYLGYFNTEEEAAIARDEYLIKNGNGIDKLNILQRT